jgi:inner membrane protein involved in colicin E2 resistance
MTIFFTILAAHRFLGFLCVGCIDSFFLIISESLNIYDLGLRLQNVRCFKVLVAILLHILQYMVVSLAIFIFLLDLIDDFLKHTIY